MMRMRKEEDLMGGWGGVATTEDGLRTTEWVRKKGVCEQKGGFKRGVSKGGFQKGSLHLRRRLDLSEPVCLLLSDLCSLVVASDMSVPDTT
eukprot:2338837-Rhodomonas_salina.2